MFFADVLFPKMCLGCGYLGVYICPKCLKKLKPVEKDICPHCERPSFFGLTHPACQKTGRLDGLVSIFYYDDFLKKIIKSIKYRLATEVWHDFCRIIEPESLYKISRYRALSMKFFLQPVPLHSHRLRERGFNQAQLIARFFHSYTNYPLSDFLKRTKVTTAQAQLKTGQKRYHNISGVFAVTTPVRGKKIILIDDVATTGATLKEAARVLKRAGAKSVYALVMAKG